MKKYSPEYYNHLADLSSKDYDEQYLEYEESEYERKRRLIFEELTSVTLTSKYSQFDAEVLKLAWNITEEAAAEGNKGKGKRLDLVPVYYVYVLLDPRKPGKFKRVIDGKLITFDFEPFYVGKGKNNRLVKHVKSARKNKRKGLNLPPKENKIISIEKEGLTVIEKVISAFSIEAIAFAKEIILISALGRRDLKLGPLTNLTDGGEGVVGVSPAVRRKAMLKRKKTIEAWSAERHQEVGNSISIGLLSRSLAEKQSSVARKLATEASWTPEQRKAKSDRLSTSLRAHYDALPTGYNKWWWESLTEEQQSTFGDRKRLDTNGYWTSLSEEEYERVVTEHRVKLTNWWESMTDEQRAARGANQTAKMRAHHATVPLEERRAVAARTQATIAAKPKEERELTKERKSVSAKSWYASLTEEQRASMKAKQDAAKANYPLLVCPNCGTLGRGGNMKRVHFDNCRY